ncbi:cupin domain-containing protein [sulfur-oxidizing endosymbiont of Gigantopelta aegis]|uniref:cupin domain-containing protein n=1 Tax=sulfur-oxidizing endosymbiont of Gigantopelta aegis TaxID=2794934 RepID=UPI0018DCC626|nr:cupin domain-containing protein [sulfur-oxidizing endosymbiont of Gigantopelta aegis]
MENTSSESTHLKSKKNSSPLGDMSVATFLAEYWQKKPLLIRGAFPDFAAPLSPDELAGLACEEDVNSRIVIEKGGEHPWQAIHGPMNDDVFANMPETHWSLVVNDLEKYLPELAWITDKFRFIPEWHLDDLMSSYAAPEGSVGPHVDLYDVFILQGEGKRRWQLNTQPVAEDNVIPDIAIRLQKEFTAEIEWILEPGDMMYIPSGVSHHGVSIGESMSYSIGFRATSHADLVNDFVAHITDGLSINKTYQLPHNKQQVHSNEISAAAIAELRRVFTEYLDPNHPELARWFGSYVSDSKVDYLHQCEQNVDNLSQLKQLLLEQNAVLMRYPSSRFAFTRDSDHCLLFVDGQDFKVSEQFVYCLCDQRILDLDVLEKSASDNELDLFINLYNSGKLYLQYEDDQECES